jgi:bifunctional N-acetylglucosamine-1-phosphate-uridyltransferase/glucosamine-1-phosphate-acetyltransferase GlmU-like protein
VTRLLVIPAAGRGSRLNTPTPKALVHVNGRPMLDHLVDLYAPFVAHVVVIAHPSFAATVAEWRGPHAHVSVAEQAAPTGMLDAVLAAAPAVRAHRPDAVWITWADQIAVRRGTAGRLAEVTAGPHPPACALPTVRRRDPYIHFDRDDAGRIVGLRQRREGDAMPAEGESDMGLFALTREAFCDDLEEYARDVPAGTLTAERNFLPFIPWLARRRPVVTFACADPMESVGINTPAELSQVETWLRSRP